MVLIIITKLRLVPTSWRLRPVSSKIISKKDLHFSDVNCSYKQTIILLTSATFATVIIADKCSVQMILMFTWCSGMAGCKGSIHFSGSEQGKRHLEVIQN